MPHPHTPYAFRCNNCGRLESGDHAGEAEIPASCRACGAGVSFDRTGIKTLDPDNWEILAAADDKRLKELGLTRALVQAHQGAAPVTTGQSISASGKEKMTGKDRTR